MPPPTKRPAQAQYPAAHVVIRIPHIFEAIIFACDSRTVTRLALTSKWVRGAVQAVDAFQVHAHAEEGHYLKCYQAGHGNRLFPCQTDIFFPTVKGTSDRLHITLDLKGGTTPLFDSNTQSHIANVVRLIARPRLYGATGDPVFRTDIRYPRSMPRARSVVAFPCPFPPFEKDGQPYQEDGRSFWCLRPPVDVTLSDGHPEWVFDRAVYHTSNTFELRQWGRDLRDYRSSIPVLRPAWHSLFLVLPMIGTNNNSLDFWDRITHAIAVALQHRTWIPGAHVTLVINTPARCSNWDKRNPIRKSQLLTRLHEAMDDYFPDGHDSHDAINIVSWNEYRASISPRQFELENIK